MLLSWNKVTQYSKVDILAMDKKKSTDYNALKAMHIIE
jgi:hypothetical protein